MEVDRLERTTQMRVKRIDTIPVTTINDIVTRYCEGIFPDLLSLDVEGLDYEILASADFGSSRPKVICVETRAHETIRMKRLLAKSDFSSLIRCGENLIFVQSEYIDMLR